MHVQMYILNVCMLYIITDVYFVYLHIYIYACIDMYTHVIKSK